MYHIHTEGLTVGYGDVSLIKDIGFSVGKGEILTLIGPNGSGKSTILKSITKQLATIAGAVYIDEEELKNISYKNLAEKLSVVLTERIQTEYMTCYDVVALGRYPYTGRMGILSDEDRQIVIESMKKVDVDSLIDKDFEKISDGQKQRVLLARAICQKTEIIVLDEPTSFLDIKYKVQLLNILRTMAKEENITVIMSLHEIDLAKKISDKILCVKGNVISYFGKPEEVFKKAIIKEIFDIDDEEFEVYFSGTRFFDVFKEG
ncbi:MAG: ABC transporter ATP-binding protein [Lachnospiraceae bacterium]|nr:ABC transporter ATP-binding protein [Lachnospiraceae bacterium]